MLKLTVFVLAVATVAAQTSSDFDPRLGIDTLVREDAFAGFLANDLARLERAEATLKRLSAERPQRQNDVMAWQAAIALYRAVRAHEQGQAEEFRRQFESAEALFSKAAALDPNAMGVNAVTGGSTVVFADRLPEPQRAAQWSRGYDAFTRLRAAQQAFFDKLPLHGKGELLAGLAVTAQRTGRQKDSAEAVEQILARLPNTAYAARAQRWKDDPGSQARANITCQGCHEPGRLAARRAELEKQ